MTPEIKHLMNERQKAHLNKKFDLSKYLSIKVAKEIKKSTTIIANLSFSHLQIAKGGTDTFSKL